MPYQTSLFDFLPSEHARHADPITSHLAAQSMKPSAGHLCAKVLLCLTSSGPQTFEEVATKLRLQPAQVWRRISDLKNKGLIEPSGITRLGKTGRAQTVWKPL